MFELNRLLKFLEIKLDEKLKSDILGMCHIDKMKEKVSIPDDFVKVTMLHKKINKEQILSMGADLKGLDLTKASPQDLISAFLTKENFSFFRKGMYYRLDKEFRKTAKTLCFVDRRSRVLGLF